MQPDLIKIYIKSGCFACTEAIEIAKKFELKNTNVELKIVDVNKLSKENSYLKFELQDRLPVTFVNNLEVSNWGLTYEQLDLSLNRGM